MIFATLLMLADVVSSASTPTEAAPVATADRAADPVKCIRVDLTGSIARKQKICRTEREWAAMRAEAQKEAGRIVQPGAASGETGK